MILRESGFALGEMVPCACPCKREFPKYTRNHKYYSEGCKDEVNREKARKRAATKRVAKAKAAAA